MTLLETLIYGLSAVAITSFMTVMIVKSKRSNKAVGQPIQERQRLQKIYKNVA